ncbi:MAG: sn-glycerol-3-phosphate ABC transporter ATP-binding protein UgpC [Rhodospirillales bacterium]|nr:sn-glycerol-3-phosphate ABC transporter ATP-binding protein UgpC [Rhodospirillales bacterium]
MTQVTLRGVVKRFGEVTVIHGVDLDISNGEFCVFVGPSGCGKSTLLRMIAGLEDVSDGEVRIGDTIVNDVDPAARGVAMVFQTYALYPHMTVEENMGFGLRMTGWPKDEVKQRVQKAASILQLDNLLKRKPKALSGGQRQRVAIGRAIVRDPKVFLFDEPLSNLDAELRVAMRVEIARLHHELSDATMIYVTHDQVEAMTLADKIVVLRDGLVEQVGSPLTLYDDPDNQFVAGFIGSPKMNFLGAKAGETNGEGTNVSLDGFDGLQMTVPLKEAPPQPGTPLTLGVRPEHFKEDGAVSLPVVVDVAEHLGGESLIYAKGKAGETMVIHTESGRSVKAGDSIPARFDIDKVYLFDTREQRVR